MGTAIKHPVSDRVKMVYGSQYYRVLESVSIASALSTTLTIYPCQIRVHQRWQSKLQLPTARKKEWRPATVGSSPHAVICQHCDTHYFSGPRTRNLPIVGWLLVRRATISAADSNFAIGRSKLMFIADLTAVFEIWDSSFHPLFFFSILILAFFWDWHKRKLLMFYSTRSYHLLVFANNS